MPRLNAVSHGAQVAVAAVILLLLSLGSYFELILSARPHQYAQSGDG